MVTVAPGMAAPVGSVMMPEIRPVTAAQTGLQAPTRSAPIKVDINFFSIRLRCIPFTHPGFTGGKACETLVSCEYGEATIKSRKLSPGHGQVSVCDRSPQVTILDSRVLSGSGRYGFGPPS